LRHAKLSFEAATATKTFSKSHFGLRREFRTDLQGQERWLAAYPTTWN
jgi:hypothetical protein